MKKVFVLRMFRDAQEGVVRRKGDTFEAEADRAADLKEKGFVSFDEGEGDEDNAPVITDDVTKFDGPEVTDISSGAVITEDKSGNAVIVAATENASKDDTGKAIEAVSVDSNKADTGVKAEADRAAVSTSRAPVKKAARAKAKPAEEPKK